MSDSLTTMSELLKGEIRAHLEVAEQSTHLACAFARLAQACVAALLKGSRVFLFGNGGSAADAQHIAAELVGRFQTNRRALPALALTTDTSALTAIANDFGYDRVFARQIEGLAHAGDVVIGISTSGNAGSVIAGLEAARARGCVAAGFTGGQGGRMVGLADPLLIVPSSVTARIQEVHILLGHTLCLAVDRAVAQEDGG